MCYGGFPFPHVSNFIVRPNTFDNSDSSTNSWTSNRKGTRVACYHTYSGVESLISLGGTFFSLPFLFSLSFFLNSFQFRLEHFISVAPM